MTEGYLDRLAARAAGQTAARVGLPPVALFEQAGNDDGDAGFEIVDEDVAAAAPAASAARDPFSTPSSAPSAAPATSRAVVPPPASAPQRSMSVPRDQAVGAVPDRVGESPSAAPDPGVAAGLVARGDRTAPASVGVETERDLVRAVPVEASLRAGAAAATAAAAQTGNAARAPEATPDVIHVTIGRVEVRASVVAAPVAARHDRDESSAEPLSLHDYLRGGRSR